MPIENQGLLDRRVVSLEVAEDGPSSLHGGVGEVRLADHFDRPDVGAVRNETSVDGEILGDRRSIEFDEACRLQLVDRLLSKVVGSASDNLLRRRRGVIDRKKSGDEGRGD